MPGKVEKFIEVYLAGLEHGSDLSQRSQVHEDNTLTWALALMGGALLALPSSLQALDLHVEWTRKGYLLACTPWFLGSITAVLGRLCYRMIRNADDAFSFHKTAHIRGVLLTADPEQEGQAVKNIVDNKAGKLDELDRAVKLWGRWTTRFFYVTHGLLVVGFLFIATFIVVRTFCR